jgi:hypothetical protein
MGRATAAGVTLGIGLGGFLDGIVLHQIAQWHNMGSAVVPPVTMEAMSRGCARRPDARSETRPAIDAPRAPAAR